MLDRKTITHDEALNKLSLVAHSLKFISTQKEGTELGSLLELLGYNLAECLLALDPPQSI